MYRRELIGLLGFGAAGSLLPGRPYAQTARDAGRLRRQLFAAEGSLAIDSHCHLFNATDLQVDGFIGRVALRDRGRLGELAARFGPYIQRLGWTVAPSAEQELALYDDLGASMFMADGAIEEAERTQYARTREALVAEAQTIERQLIEAPGAVPAHEYVLRMETARVLQTELPEDYDDFLERVDDDDEDEPQTFGVGFFSLLGFVISQFQYRLTSLRRYLRIYNRRSPVRMDLLTPSLVDYDYWLAGGRPTKSSLPKQIEVMTRLSRIAQGSVHGFVPFDPFREMAFRVGEGDYSSLDLVREAIGGGAFIGVKLYPPMGFAPFGNAGEDAVWKSKDWLPAIAHADGFGAKLDEALGDLYRYCIDHEVPVLAHSNISNTAHVDYDKLLAFDYWRRAIEAHKGLRLNVGHFGGAGSTTSYDATRVRQFAELMPRHPKLYADSSYFGELLEDARAMRQRLGEALVAAPQLAERLVYGSDWKMLALERKSKRYLRRMVELVDDLDLDRGSFFGGNAARYLGLDGEGEARMRLRNFHGSDPAWMEKST